MVALGKSREVRAARTATCGNGLQGGVRESVVAGWVANDSSRLRAYSSLFYKELWTKCSIHPTGWMRIETGSQPSFFARSASSIHPSGWMRIETGEEVSVVLAGTCSIHPSGWMRIETPILLHPIAAALSYEMPTCFQQVA